MTPEIINSTYVRQVLALHEEFPDRKVFHEKVGSVLKAMAQDKSFMRDVVKRNFDDEGFLAQQWSGYNIPFLYIFENDFVNIKIHFISSPGKQGGAYSCTLHSSS